MTENRRNEPATEPQKDKLRFFGCTWDDGITAGQATDALKECAKLFPDREAAWQMQKTECPKNPETFPVEAFEKLDATISEEVTIQKAEIVETKPTPAAAPAFIPPSPEPQSKIEAPPHEVPIQTAKSLSAQPSARHEGFFSGTAERRRDANLSNNQLENAASDAQDSAAIKAHYSPQTDSYTFVPIYSTSEQLNAIRAYGKQPPKGLTFTEAEKLLEQCKILHLIKLRADILRRATIQKAETAAGQPSVRREGFFSGESQPETRKTEAASCQSTKEWDEWFALLGQIKKWAIPFGDLAAQEVTIQEVATAATQPGARHEDEETGVYSPKVQDLIAQLKNPDKHARDRAAIELGRSKNPLAVKPLISSLEDDHWGTGVHAAEALGELGFPDAVEPLVESLKSSELYVRATAAKALGKIKDTRAIAALSLTLKDPSEFVRKAAHEALSKIRGDARIPPPQIFAQRPASNQPALIPTWQSVDDLLTGWPSSDGCYWLPVKVAATLVGIIAETKLTNAQSRQIANQIEWNRYCFEPDARYGGGTYDIDQTLVVFKPFAGDQVNPSPGYLGAANFLRLCVLIAAADGQIDEVELDVFRQVIETQLDLTPTDHRRLQLLEKLLVQDPSSAAKTLANVAKSIPAHKRLLIGKVLVRVAAADTVITKDERRALERIFKAFEIPQDTLENLMLQACPQSQAEMVQKTAPVSIPVKPETPEALEDELTLEKEWDEWVALQERLAERQKQSLSGATHQKVEAGEATAQHTPQQLQKKKVESSKVEQGQKMKEYVPATSQFLSKQDTRPATEKQLAYLNLFGFVPDRPLTIVEASALIEQFSRDPERQKVRDGNYVNQKLKEYDDLNTNQAFYMRNDIDEAKRELEKAEEDDTNDAEAIVDYVENVEYVRNCRLDFWADTFDLPVNIQYGTYRQCSVYEQKTKFYLASGHRFELPAPEQIQVVLDILDADSATWDKDMPEIFFQTLEHSFPQLLRKDIDLEALAIEKKDAKDFLDGFRELHRESEIRLSALRSSNFQTPRPAVGARPQYPDVSENYHRPTQPEPLVQDAPRHFALDMVKVDFITNETREVVGILSELMEDEPEATVTPSQRVEMSAPEIPQVSGGDKSAPQPSRFGGLNVAFIPILDRLLARDSWPPADFNALAREFQFMPLNIRDTLNEWSDEALGDFILDGEDPVFVRRELMTKEKI